MNVYVGKAGKVFRKATQQIVDASEERIGRAGRLVVELVTHAPKRFRYDVDNYAKCLLDSLTHAGVWEDDGQIDRLIVTRGPVEAGGGIEVRILEVQ